MRREETLEVRSRSTETRSTYNIVVEVEGVIDVHCASLTSQGVQHMVFYPDGHPSRYQPPPTGLNFGEQTRTGVFPLVIAAPQNRVISVLAKPISSKVGINVPTLLDPTLLDRLAAHVG